MQEISDEEGRLILGERGLWSGKGSYDAIKNTKEDEIEKETKELLKEEGNLRRENREKEGESKIKYEERLKKLAKSEAELGFRWTIGLVNSIIESGGYEEVGKEKVMAVLIGEGSNTEEILSRYKQVSEMGEIVHEKVDIRVLQEEGMFDEDNRISKEFINEYVKPKLIVKEIDRELKEVGYEGKNAGEKLVGKMGEGYSRGAELNKAIVEVLALFEDVESMYEYLGVEKGKGRTKEEIAAGAYRTYKRALRLFSEGEIGEEGLKQETEIIRTVSEMLMIVQEKAELEAAINEKGIGIETLNKIESMVNIESTKVNKYVFIKELGEQIRGISNGEEVFEIKIEEIKKGLERKGEKGVILPKEMEKLKEGLGEGKRGKRYETALTMEMKKARAVLQAA
jgi:hypothetical protein